MVGHAQSFPVFQFEKFELDVQEAELRKGGRKIKLQEKPFQILVLLLENAGHIVTRQKLRNRLWPADTFVDFDRNLNTAIKKLREALGDSAEASRFVETVPRHGYRFIAPVKPGDVTSVRREAAEVVEEERSSMALLLSLLGARLYRFRLTAFALMPVLVLGAYLTRQHFFMQPEVCPPRITVAVLPFRDVGEDPAQQVFSAGLTEELTTQLGHMNPGLMGVIASRSVMKYRYSGKSIEEIGRELRVEYILEGSVRRVGDRLRITTQLVSVRDQTQVLAETYDLHLGDPLRIQREVTRRVVESLAGCLLPVERAGVSPLTRPRVEEITSVGYPRP